ncbi:hypothetical protein ABIA32_005366 [Streptacidiphilus sp. MAP12-20]
MSHPLQLRADYRPPGAAAQSEPWHIVHRGGTVGLCGLRMAPVGEVQSILRLSTLPGHRTCRACRIRHSFGHLSLVDTPRVPA